MRSDVVVMGGVVYLEGAALLMVGFVCLSDDFSLVFCCNFVCNLFWLLVVHDVLVFESYLLSLPSNC